jgi:hypothetical protein
VIYPGSAPVGNATLVVANVLTCNKHSQMFHWLYFVTAADSYVAVPGCAVLCWPAGAPDLPGGHGSRLLCTSAAARGL